MKLNMYVKTIKNMQFNNYIKKIRNHVNYFSESRILRL